MLIVELILMFLVPALFVFLTKRVKFFSTVGAITLCYAFGFLLSVLPLPFDKDLIQTVASVLVAIAIPLILFGFDILSVRSLAKKTIIAFALMIVSVVLVSSAVAFIASGSGLREPASLAGMATGLYIGGTPNLFAIGAALLDDKGLINLANVSDSLIGGIYILLVFAVIAKIYKKLLGERKTPHNKTENTDSLVTGEYDYSVLPRDKKGIVSLVLTCLLAVACLGLGVLVEILVNGNMDGSLFIIVTVSVLGLVLSFVKTVRRVKGTYQIGQYLILVFSLGLGMSIDWSRLVNDILPTLLFFGSVQMCAILVHFILCKIFRIDGGTALTTSIAGIYGPPFIAPVANAYGDRSLIVPGVICGTFGLAVGNLIGIALGNILSLFI